MTAAVQGIDKKQDVDLKKNAPKRVFCRKYDGYDEFCKGEARLLIVFSTISQLIAYLIHLFRFYLAI